ncbi:MAG: hypothetical protein CM15mV85_130 [uncultured marine virus]|nr:MAG: hypothetical protein CM15mV85_130 [uncultured marine virus]
MVDIDNSGPEVDVTLPERKKKRSSKKKNLKKVILKK